MSQIIPPPLGRELNLKIPGEIPGSKHILTATGKSGIVPAPRSSLFNAGNWQTTSKAPYIAWESPYYLP